MNRLTRGWTRVWLGMQWPLLRRRVGRHVLERLDGVRLLILPEVFNPTVFASSAFLARAVATLPLADHRKAWAASPDRGEARVLDMGTGSGVGAIFAARRGFRSVGVDINPEAVRCARINALLNQVEDRVEIRHGDLFDPVKGEQFELVLFNPPFFRGVPRSPLEVAWQGTDVMERFAAGLPAALTPGGRALLVLSTEGDADGMLAALKEQALTVAAVARQDCGNEILTIYSASPSR
ncbi:MAG TPA: HemK2/MTQ2 family protein methyltransferase [Methylomirabilota bacterium]|nr:HemK2/MTQ2 family protein methyltransferase [Methylomirabilota bacterium]